MNAYKYRIYPNKAQKELIAKHFGCSRFIYNWGLETKILNFGLKLISGSERPVGLVESPTVVGAMKREATKLF